VCCGLWQNPQEGPNREPGYHSREEPAPQNPNPNASTWKGEHKKKIHAEKIEKRGGMSNLLGRLGECDEKNVGKRNRTFNW